MEFLYETMREAIETDDYSLKTIDPRDKAYNEEEDSLLFKEAYTKAMKSIGENYKKTSEKIEEGIVLIRNDKDKIGGIRDTKYSGTVNLFCMNPVIPCNLSLWTKSAYDKLDRDLSSDAADYYTDNLIGTFRVCSTTDLEIGTIEGHIDTRLGSELTLDININFIKDSLSKILGNLITLKDELYRSQEFIVKVITETKDCHLIEAMTRLFDCICKTALLYFVVLLKAAYKFVLVINKPEIITEATINKENVTQYLDEMNKLIDEIRAFYDNFEYKEIITPRKKKEHKMYEYMLGALERKYKLKVPMYKVVGVSKDVKEIVEEKFIKKLEGIMKKYPNFCLLSPSWDDDDDMFIYVTLREPFGEKEDREDRVDQTKTIQEASMTAKERNALKDSDFGLPEDRKYPLNDEKHIKEAIKFFGYCNSAKKETLARNIVEKVLVNGLFGKIFISAKHPNKDYFPVWFVEGSEYTLKKHDDETYTILDKDGEKVDWYTIEEDKDTLDESIILDTNGKLY